MENETSVESDKVGFLTGKSPRNRSLLVIHQNRHVGGGQTYTDELVAGLKRRDYRVTLVQSLTAPKVIGYLARRTYRQVIWIVYQEFPLWVYLFSWIAGKKNVLLVLNFWSREVRLPYWQPVRVRRRVHSVWLKLARWAKQGLFLVFAHGLVHLSRYARGRLFSSPAYRLAGGKPETMIAGGYDRRQFYFLAKPERDGVREALGLKPSDILFLMAGRVDMRKNYEAGFRVFQKLRKRKPKDNLWLYWVISSSAASNDVGYLAYLMEYMARLGIGDRVRVISGITHSQMAAYYQAADLLVMPSREDETFGLVTLEALACGCPVFGFRACANEEIVRFKPFKFLAKNGDGAGLTELMAAYLALSGQSKTAIRKGVAQSVVYFRWSRAVGRLTALLKVV